MQHIWSNKACIAFSRVSTALAMLVLPTVALADAVQWTEGGNGHWYLDVVQQATWAEADATASAVGAHLATTVTYEEFQFVWGLAGHGRWLGARQPVGSVEPAGGWEWVTGEPWNDWPASIASSFFDDCDGGGNPTCADGCTPDGQQDRVITWQYGTRIDDDNEWGCPEDGGVPVLHSYVLEWSADCNGDGIVDYGQILDGTYADNDGNGVPDCCDAGEPCDVPGADLTVDDDLLDYPDANFTSIQAAIDAAQDGDLILVYPGTYTGTGNYVVDFGTKQLQLIAAAGFSSTSIDGEDVRGLINCSGYHDGFTTIRGFSMTRANATGLPAAINFHGESGPTLSECRIHDMTLSQTLLHAGPEHLGDPVGHPRIEWCIFENIDMSEGGNCLSFNYNNPVIEGCTFRNNVAYEQLCFSYWSNNTPTYIDCIFQNNITGVAGTNEPGVLVARAGSHVSLSGCTFSGNTMHDSCVVYGSYDIADTTFCENIPSNDICGSWTDLGGNEFLDECTGFVDCNENGVPDYDDIDSGYSEDCNSNSIPDECDIAEGTSEDCNSDGIPDECQGIGGGNIWSNPLGGDLLDPANWTNCEAPGPDGDLVFPLSDNYTVACPSAQIGSASVTDGNVIFLLDGVLTVEPADIYQNALSINTASPTTSLTLRSVVGGNGELDCHQISIADGGDSHGTLIVEGESTTLRLANEPATINVGPVGVGLMTLTDGATMTTAKLVLGQNQSGARGELLIDNGATLNVGIQLTIENNSKATVMGGGTVVSEPASIGILVNHGGRLRGEGVVDADVRNYGVVETLIGQPLHVLKNYFQPAPSTLAFSGSLTAGISGPSTWSSMHSDKEAYIAGLLDLTIDAAYTPAVDSQWPVLTAEYGINGTFDVGLVTGLPDGMYADIVYSNALGGDGGDTVTVVFGSLDAPLAFDSPAPVTLNATPTAMLLQDLDGDGADELIITTAGDPGVVLVYPNEGGLFASEPLSLSVGPSPAALAAGDFTGDGEIEIASADAVDGSITFIRDPLGNSESVTYQTDGGGIPVSLAASNFLDDAGSDELAVACAGTNTIEFWQFNAGLRSFGFVPSLVVQLDDTPGGIDPGQVNEDKDAFVPLAVTLPAAGGVVVLNNDGNGDFPASETYPAGVDSAQVRMASLDGLATTPNDLVVLNQTDGTISILLDQGNSYLPAANLPVGQNPDSIDLADLDADGDQDIVLVAIDSSTGESTVLILRNDFVPTGQLVFAPAAHLELPAGTIPVLVGDGAVDFDIYPDLVTINDGGAGFRSGSPPSFSIARNGLCNFPNCVGDFNDDGLVGVDDLLAWLDGFGTSDGDVDCDGASDINDLLVLLGNWGPCN